MSRYMLSRRDGYDLRFSMMEDRLRALPEVLIQKILGILGANEAAVRIQRYFRGLTTRIKLPSIPAATVRSQVAWLNYGGTYSFLNPGVPRLWGVGYVGV